MPRRRRDRATVRAPIEGRRPIALRPFVVLVALAAGWPLGALANPQFTFRNPPGSPEVVWTTTAQAGLSSSTGNTSSFGVSGQGKVARTDARWRFALSSELAFARSRIDVADEANGVAGVGPGELRTVRQTTRQAWWFQARTDRFLTQRNGAFVASRVGGDRPAGKELVASTQVGWAFDLVPVTEQQLRLELGYDFTYEEEVAALEARQIHFGRGWLGYGARLDEKLSVELSTEVLANFSGEAAVGPFSGTRVVSSGALTYKLNGSVSLALRTTASYDAAPSPRPPPAGTFFEPGFAPPAAHWDTTTDLLAIVTF
jgi:hypothetical protein